MGRCDRFFRRALCRLDAPHLFDRPGGPYLGPDGRDWPDNHRRFGALSRAAADLALGDVVLPDGWRPDVVHLHDWQAALTAAYLRFDRRAATAPPTVLTIHNLAFQGVFPRASAIELGLPSQAMLPEGAEYWGSLSFLKAGVQWCDRITTVSPTYAREILTPEHGMGFDGLLRLRAEHLTGIVNGLDTTVWDPSTDPYLVAPYSSRRLHPKAENKRATSRKRHVTRPPAPRPAPPPAPSSRAAGSSVRGASSRTHNPAGG